MAIMKQLAIASATLASQSLTGAPTPAADGWHDIAWQRVTRNVKRLQTCIVKAIQVSVRRFFAAIKLVPDARSPNHFQNW